MLWEFKQGNSAKVTTEKIRSVNGEGLITHQVVRHWYTKFWCGNTTVKDELRTGHPSYFYDNLVNAIFEQNAHQSIIDIKERLNAPQSTVTWIVTYSAIWRN